MYFKRLLIEHNGPISKLDLSFPKNSQQPKPLVIVGENGTGKSILLSHLVNALVTGKQAIYEDSEVEKGKVYKYRSPTYIKSGESFCRSEVEFDSGEKLVEWQLLVPKKDYEQRFGSPPDYSDWNQIRPEETSAFTPTFNPQSQPTQEIFKKQCCLYFPSNRFEEPAWLNQDNLRSKAKYSDLKKISGYSNRNLISTSPLKDNINWLLDVLLDKHAFEIRQTNFPVQTEQGHALNLPIFSGFDGQSAKILQAITDVLKAILREEGNLRLGFGSRHNRSISVIKDDKQWIPNLFNLSTGELQLFNLFVSIIRDYDLSEGTFTEQSQIKGIVIVDEIDSNLHTVHQKEILPDLIKSFPNVQFIVTTHAPLFLVGMTEKFGTDGYQVITMPTGQHIPPDSFSEFIAAYEAFKETEQHRVEIEKVLDDQKKPIVFVEGNYDVTYLTTAASLLNRQATLEAVQLEDGEGFGNLNNIWKNHSNPSSKVLLAEILLMYDCDIDKPSADKNKLHKRTMPTQSTNPIKKGIENLFPQETIGKAKNGKPDFFDEYPERQIVKRGQPVTEPAYIEINVSEKKNLCDWLCEHGDASDFQNFDKVFDLIEVTLSLDVQTSGLEEPVT